MHNSFIVVIFFVPLSLLLVQCGDSADQATAPERTVYFDILTIELAEDDQFFMNRPGGIAQDSRGNLYVLDTGDRHILKFSPEGEFISYIGQPGEGPGEFQQPMAFTVEIDSLDQRRSEVINRIRREQGGLDPNLVIVTPYIAGFDLLHNNHLLLGLPWNNYLYLIDDSGTVIEKIQCKAIETADFELSGTGSFVVTDNDRIIMIDPINGLLWKGEL